MRPVAKSLGAAAFAAACLALALAATAQERAPEAPAPSVPQTDAAPRRPATPAEIDALVKNLGSDDYSERERATERLGEIGKPAHAALRRALESDDAEVRYRARLVLRAGLRKVTALLQDLSYRSASRDDDAFKALVDMGPDAIEHLVFIVRRDLQDYQGEDERLRLAIQAIEEIGKRAPPAAEEAREALLSILDVNLHNFQGQFAGALKTTGEDDGRAAVAKRLAAKESPVRQNAVEILGLLRGPASVEALTGALKDPDPLVRAEAVRALVEAGRVSPEAAHLTPEAAGAIVLALDDPDRSVETRAIEALGELREPRALPHLRKLVERAGGGEGGDVGIDDERLAAAIRAIGLLEDHESVPRLLPLLGSQRADVLACAADALGALKAKEAVAPLLALLEKDDLARPANVLKALGRIGDARALEPLKAYYVGHEPYRQRALRAIARLEGDAAAAFLVERAKGGEDEAEVRIALDALSRRGEALGGPAPAELGEVALAALARQPVPLRVDALKIIARVKYAPAVDAVIRLVSSADPRIAAQAADTLAALGDKKAVASLKLLLKSMDENVKRSAIVALAKLGEDEALRGSIAEGEAALAKEPDNRENRFQLGLDYLYAREWKKGAEQFEAILASKPKDELAAYNLACARSLLGDKAAAIAALRLSVENGFREWRHMEQDTDLDNIRATPEMKAIMQELRRESGVRRAENGVIILQLGGQMDPGLEEDDAEEGE